MARTLAVRFAGCLVFRVVLVPLFALLPPVQIKVHFEDDR